MKPPSLLNGLAVIFAAGASAQPQSPPELQAGTNTLEIVSPDGVFRTYGNGSPTMVDMQARFADPQQRAKMREDHRQSFIDSHYGVADALRLDAETFDKLIELLTDQQMERSERFYKEFAARIHVAERGKQMHVEAERVTKQIEALREVLGQEKLERYQKLQPSLGHRRQLRELDERLGDADKFDSVQHERLVELFYAQLMSSINRMQGSNLRRSMLSGVLRAMPSQEELQRSSLLQTIASNEDTWRELPESNRQLNERAAAFLTERQLAMLAQMQSEQLAEQQQRIEQMRTQAGLSATIPAEPQVKEVPPAQVDRDVKLSLKVAVDNESPRYLTTVVSSGKPASLKISKALSLEATTVAFDNGDYNLRVEYFETGVTGRRVIGNMGQAGTLVQASEAERASYVRGGGGGTVITGSKGYAVELSVLVEST